MFACSRSDIVQQGCDARLRISKNLLGDVSRREVVTQIAKGFG